MPALSASVSAAPTVTAASQLAAVRHDRDQSNQPSTTTIRGNTTAASPSSVSAIITALPAGVRNPCSRWKTELSTRTSASWVKMSSITAMSAQLAPIKTPANSVRAPASGWAGSNSETARLRTGRPGTTLQSLSLASPIFRRGFSQMAAMRVPATTDHTSATSTAISSASRMETAAARENTAPNTTHNKTTTTSDKKKKQTTNHTSATSTAISSASRMETAAARENTAPNTTPGRICAGAQARADSTLAT